MQQNVYIGSLPRSGSTLLGMMLDQHKSCFHMGESHYWKKYKYGETKCSCGDLNCNLLKFVFSRIKEKENCVFAIHEACKILDFLPTTGKKIVLSDKIKNIINLSYEGLNFLCDIFRKETGKNLIIDKSTNIRIAKYLTTKKDWKVILLTRDPRGMLYSRKKSSIRHNVKIPSNMFIPIFIDFAEIALELRNLDNVLWVKYEDLCRNTENELKKICKFLFIPYDFSMLDFKSSQGHTVMGNRMRFDDKFKIIEDLDWKTMLNCEEKKAIYNNKKLITLYQSLSYFL